MEHGVEEDCLGMCLGSCQGKKDLTEYNAWTDTKCENYFPIVEMCCNGTLAANITAVVPRITKTHNITGKLEVKQAPFKILGNTKLEKNLLLHLAGIPHCCMEHGVEEECLGMCFGSCQAKAGLKESNAWTDTKCENYFQIVEMCCNGKKLY